jgi:thiol-disulfide isomerase/thioredoxin
MEFENRLGEASKVYCNPVSSFIKIVYAHIMFDRGAFLGQVRLAGAPRRPALGITQPMADADAGLLGTAQAVVIEFWGNGCVPCEQYKPVFDAVAGNVTPDILMASVNVDSSPVLSSRYNIQATPTTLFLATGTEVNRVEGKMTADDLAAAIQAAFGAGPSAQAQAAAQRMDQSLTQPQQPSPGAPQQTTIPVSNPAQFTTPPAAAVPPPSTRPRPAAPTLAPSSGPSKTLLIAGGVAVVGIVATGLWLTAKG